ncbi:MAG: GIY-YIG nuclease family protein [Parvibaculum sp.]|nr:GIY-YIG nuclease family protein [Parvibaculum sp.]|tara:strand:+ start:2240 stop:2491 length:252 start_codon:yes stop_codon:yes gene_type:complete
MQKPWYLYILECDGGRLYTGITVDVDARFKAHVSGRGAKFTRAYPPRRIAFVEPHVDRSTASKAEYAIKKLTPDAKRKLIADR